ncbi:MAG: nucleotide exchange factor GrpE [Candidatus Aminicenantes bacterium]|nr:nucleotide exchange factor GrpE [Candidatus Aminicenantes bacterium]
MSDKNNDTPKPPKESYENIPINQDDDMEIEYLTAASEEDDKIQEKKRSALIKKLKKDVEALSAKNQKIREEYLRQMADKENLRKRLEKEKKDYFQYALGELIKEFLVILDNLERALASAGSPETEKGLKEGVEMILKQFQGLLTRQGVVPIDVSDKEFNPHIHQAFMTEESDDVDEMLIKEELQKGYKIHDRLLRPTMVKVAVPKKEN